MEELILQLAETLDVDPQASDMQGTINEIFASVSRLKLKAEDGDERVREEIENQQDFLNGVRRHIQQNRRLVHHSYLMNWTLDELRKRCRENRARLRKYTLRDIARGTPYEDLPGW